MKKSFNPTDIQQKESLELSKKLYRTIGEQSKQLDDARSCVFNVCDLFAPALRSQRRKFCDYCDRLIFSDPLLYGRKGEELLWRKGFYDVISMAKRLKKKEFTQEEVSSIQAHIYSGIGFYHHMLTKLSIQFNIHLQTTVDCKMLLESNVDPAEVNDELKEWAKQTVYQCLIYLGDLSRYRLELKTKNSDPSIAIRYYLQAISFKPNNGMPYNQMGTLAMYQNNLLDAVYHYLRCLACKVPFEGTTNNLQNLFEKNSKFIEQLPRIDEDADCIVEPDKSDNIRRFIARFLLLIDIWYFNKKVPKVYSLCHQTYKNLEECLTYCKPTPSESDESSTLDMVPSDPDPSYINGQMIFKAIVICLLVISKLQANNSPSLSTLIAFTLSIYSQLIQKLCRHIEEAVLNYPTTESKRSCGVLGEIIKTGKKGSKSKLRRRKALIVESEESDASENGYESDSSSSDESYTSSNEDVLVETSDEDIESHKVMDDSQTASAPNHTKDKQKGASKNKDFVLRKVQKMDINIMLEIINEEGLLQSIRVVSEWLKSDKDIIKSCVATTSTLVKQLVQLINLININFSSARSINLKFKVSKIIKNESKIPLPEDVTLKNIRLFELAQAEYDWDYLRENDITSREENVIRILKILSFGKILTKIEDTGVTFDETKNILIFDEKDWSAGVDSGHSESCLIEELERQEETEVVNKPSLTNGELKSTSENHKMKHMGQLWLASEVRALETRVGSTKATLSPYLVIDADALIKYTRMVKQLVYSRQFILLVPVAVVSALDDLKKECIEARDAIRWLEAQFQRGNRFFRAQRPHERAAIPLIKYPKKKDKEMHVFIQIIECCYYFTDQQKGASNVVTFLMGTLNSLGGGDNKEFSYGGLAKSVGIILESITSFYAKWKKNMGTNR
ncbi:nonsense-mediated mRNA decay factor SMG5 isoform X2 [Anthonomus grandis grandis]|uniref:nonsense-mediated mRNA decay factor SMG5 isoform X2 n=1 Tax=Anthonomus grandis grandis TaxID=2921223 RepID=UPI0021659514|nr:nonsense-mediated mRNA decay factor SMG5 isoform X2 [Anthonomus grandis grandis]